MAFKQKTFSNFYETPILKRKGPYKAKEELSFHFFPQKCQNSSFILLAKKYKHKFSQKKEWKKPCPPKIPIWQSWQLRSVQFSLSSKKAVY